MQHNLSDDPLVEKFMSDVAEGKAHLQETIRVCRILSNTNRSSPGVDLIANLGGNTFSSYRPRYGWAKLCRKVYGAELHPIDVEVTVICKDNQKRKMKLKVILLFDVLTQMHNVSKAQFSKAILGTRGFEGLKWYWDNLRGGVDHVVNSDPTWAPKRDKAIPLYVHSDGVEIHRNVPFLVFSCSSALVSGIPSLDQQLLTLAMEEHWACQESYSDITDLYKYLEDALSAGRVPYTEPLTNKPWKHDSYWALYLRKEK